MYIANAINIVN